MAFNQNYYGNYYPGNNYMNAQNPQPQIQNSGFVMVRSEMEARNFPVALGNSVTFKDETAPYIYSKTMGFSQLDRPIFEKYKLVKEETSENVTIPTNPIIDNIKNELVEIWAEIDAIKNGNKKIAQKEVDIDEQCV